MPNELLTSHEAALRLGCSTSTVRRLVASGDLAPTRKLHGPNGAFLFTEEAVEALRTTRNAA